jgi:ribokinase
VTPTLAVVGAINVDLVVTASRLPAAGETVSGGSFATHQGGKGGNQAVAAARALGDRGRVIVVGAVGDDDLGSGALEALADAGVIAAVDVTDRTPTGVALIVVGESGENQIAVAPGANTRVTAELVERSLHEHEPAVVLASLEVPEESVRAASEWCRAHRVPLVLNPAPAQPWIRDLAAVATYVTPNEGELVALGDLPREVVVLETRGAEGVRIHAATGTAHAVEVPAPRVAVVDTTGAGDCFNGVFAAGLSEGLEVAAAAQRAAAAAALSVTKVGAREGMPTRDELDAFLRHA